MAPEQELTYEMATWDTGCRKSRSRVQRAEMRFILKKKMYSIAAERASLSFTQKGLIQLLKQKGSLLFVHLRS